MAPPVAVEEQVLILQTMLLLVEAAEKKQYDAPWREGGKKVWRDASGRFTRDGGGGGGADTLQIPAISKQYAVAQDLVNQTQQSLENAIEQSPEFAANLADNLFGDGAQKLRNNVARFYRKNAPDLAKAIKNENPWAEISGAVQGLVKGGDRKQSAKDLAGGIVHAFKWVGAKYNEGLDQLNNLEGPPAVRMLGKVAAAAIPVGVFLAATLTPELAIGLMVGEGLTSILAGAAVGQAVSFGVNKALDAAHVENPWLRIGVDIVAGVAAAGGVAAGVKRFKASQLKAAAAEAAQEAELFAAKEATTIRYGVNNIASYEMPSATQIETGAQELGKGVQGGVYRDKTHKGIAYKVWHQGEKGLHPLQVLVFRIAKGKTSTASEIRISKAMGDIGVGPKVHAWDQDRMAFQFLNDHETGALWAEKNLPNTRNPFATEEKLRNQRQKASQFIGNIVDQVEAMHLGGIVHQDLHMANMMVGPDGSVKIIDFGLSRETAGLPPASAFKRMRNDIATSIFHPGLAAVGAAPLKDSLNSNLLAFVRRNIDLSPGVSDEALESLVNRFLGAELTQQIHIPKGVDFDEAELIRENMSRVRQFLKGCQDESLDGLSEEFKSKLLEDVNRANRVLKSLDRS